MSSLRSGLIHYISLISGIKYGNPFYTVVKQVRINSLVLQNNGFSVYYTSDFLLVYKKFFFVYLLIAKF